MKVTALTENRSSGDLCGEHGLSVYIEYQGKNTCWIQAAPDCFWRMRENWGLRSPKLILLFVTCPL